MSKHAQYRIVPALLLMVLLGAAVPSAAPSGTEESRDFSYASGLHADGGYDMAIREFERFIDAYPASRRLGEACYCIADSWFHRKRPDLTVELTARIRTQYPSTTLMDRVLFLEGKALSGLGRPSEAILTLNRFLSDYAGSGLAAEALYTVAESRLALKDTRQAAETFRTVAERYPASAVADWAWYNLGVISEGAGDSRGAIEAFGQVFRRYPLSVLRNRCRFRMGECYFRLSEYRNAISMMSDVVSSVSDRDTKARGYFLLGEANFHLGDYSVARKNYQTVCDEFPNDSLAEDAREAVGWTFFQEKRFDRAAEIFAAVERQNPGKESRDAAQFRQALTRKLAGDAAGAAPIFSAIPVQFPESRYAERSLYELGMLSWDARRFPEAAEFFQGLTTRYPLSELKPEALIMSGQCLLEGKDYGSAITAFTEVTDSHRNSPSYPVALHERSFCELKLLQFDAAALNADRFFRSFPDHALAADALMILSEARYRLGDYEGSGQAGLTALEKYPQSPRMAEALYGYGWSSFRTGEYEKAAAAFSRVQERHPQSAFAADAASRVGDCQYALGEYPQAVEAYRAALDRFPDGPFAGRSAIQYGRAAYQAGDYRQALEAVNRVLAKYPKTVNPDEARNLKGMSLLNLERYPEAAEEFKTIVKPSPLADEALFQTGVCYLRLGMTDKAVESWERLMQEFARSPRVSEAVCSMADIRRVKGDDAGALRLIDDFLDRYPPEKVTGDVLLRKGELASGMKKYDAAVTAFRRIVEEYPAFGGVARAWYGLGMASGEKGDADGARTAFETLAAKYPPSEYAPLAARRLEEMEKTAGAEASGGGVPEKKTDVPDRVRADADSALVEEGAALLRNGKTEEGEEKLRAVIARHSTDTLADRARLELAEDALNRGDGESAEELAVEVTEHRMDENAAHAGYLLGKQLYLAEDYSAAEHELTKAAALYRAFGEWAARARLLAARSQVKLGKRDAALDNLKELLASSPGEAVRKEAQDFLKELQGGKK